MTKRENTTPEDFAEDTRKAMSDALELQVGHSAKLSSVSHAHILSVI